MRNLSIFCANRTGGQGKTLTSQIIEYGYSLNGCKLTAISADATKEGSSKLARLLNGVVEMSIGVGIADLRTNQHLALQHWDTLGKYLLKESCLVDVGANVFPSILEWARERNASRILKDHELVLVVPVTTQMQSILDATEILRQSLDEPALPFSERYVVLNEYHGSFGDISQKKELQEIYSLRKRGVKFVTLERANVEIWEQFEMKSYSLRQLASLTVDDFEKHFGIDPFAASGVEMEFKTWLTKTINAFHEAGIVPVPQPSFDDDSVSAQHTDVGDGPRSKVA